jgi:hypothetical protein
METKLCSKCKQLKSCTEFSKSTRNKDGLDTCCKTCRNQINKQYRDDHKELFSTARKAYYIKNKDKILKQKSVYAELHKQEKAEYDKRYRQENKNKLRKQKRDWEKNSIKHKIANNLRRRIHHLLKGESKSSHSLDLLGCSVEFLQQYLSEKFQEGMTWNNYGQWHIDHVIPCASFDLNDPNQQKQCFHYTNLQPLWAIDNLKKSKNMNTRIATEQDKLTIGEFLYFKRLIMEVYPTGIVSIVSDTWDFWNVLTNYLPRLKNDILNRDGRVVIRPDSGDPVKIICGDTNAPVDSPEYKGAYQILSEIFGFTTNEAGYKVLDSHIGLIYGDSITLERQDQIYSQLEKKGFAATNLVLGVGSFTYQYRSRDSLGFAMKATWCQINGEAKEIFKNPKTDSGMKKSLKGLIRVCQDKLGNLFAVDCVSKEEEEKSLLQTVFRDGVIRKGYTLADIRKNVNNTL